jgi:eukaryotic-like serine/threonine-protein kinase
MEETKSMNVEDIFSRALQIQNEADRAAYLEKACAGDLGLRKRVESLLLAHGEAASFLEQPVHEVPAETSPPEFGSAPSRMFRSGGYALIAESPGTMVGRYKLLQQIGEGGMGVVYMAEQEKPVRRRVALKIIKPGMDSAQVIARFEAERQALAMMDHPNIARVFDVGTTDTGRPYFVMELVQGIPITHYCDDKLLDTPGRLELFIQVCNAIQHAHQKGIIHRDLKPSNVLIAIYDGKPVPKIIDFGVAKALHQRLTEKTMFTQFGAVVGTLEYMSPEQADMDLMGTDTRSDIYSLGVLLYELLTGSTPLDGKKLRSLGYAEMLKTIREVDPPKPSTRLSQSSNEVASISACRQTEPRRLQRLVAGDLDWIVMKCLEKDRTRRYETATGLAQDIQRHMQDEAVLASPPGQLYKFQKLVRRNKLVFGAIGCVMGALVLGMVVSTWEAVRATRATQEARLARRQSDDNAKKAVHAEADEKVQRQKAELLAVENENNYQTARQNLYAADMAAASQAIDQGYQSTCFSADGRAFFTAGENGLRRWNLANGALVQTLSSAVDFQRLRSSPDGKLLACGTRNGTIQIWNLRDEGKLVGILRGQEASVDGLAFTPDGTMLVSGATDHTICIWHATSTTARPSQSISAVTLQRFESGPFVRFSANGKWLAVHGGDGNKSRIMIVDVGQCRVCASLPTLALPLGFFPDGHTLLALDTTQTDLNGRNFTSPLVGPSGKPQPGHIELWDWKARTDRVVPLRNVPPYGVTAFALSQDGDQLALTLASPDKDNRMLYSVNPITGDCVLQNLLLGPTVLGGLSFSPDGHYLAVADGQRTLLCHWPGVASFVELTEHTGTTLKPLFSPDGTRVAIGDTTGEVPMWDMPSGKVRVLLAGQGESTFSASFSADNLTLAADAGSAVKLWHLATRRELFSFNNTASVEFSPDGQVMVRVGIPANQKSSAFPFSLAHLPTLNEIDNPRPQTFAEAAKSQSGVFQPVMDEADVRN